MPERDCSNHTKMVTVQINDRQSFKKTRRIDITAAQLRVLAEYTDGYCAIEHATDADLDSIKGMQFWFTSTKKQDTFRNRIRWYINEDIVDALTVI